MMQNLAYPWLENAIQQLERLYQSQKFPHALLIAGEEGLGQQALINELSQLLLCLGPVSHHACGVCRACHLFREQHHPDFRYLGDNSTNISIDDIREITAYLSQSSHQAGNRIVVIAADNLTLACANALLKTLEEPPKQTYFMLVAKHPSAVLATIRSRCFVVNLSVPSHSQSLSWLKQQYPDEADNDLAWHLKVAGGVPLKVQAMTPQTLDKSQDLLESILYSQNLQAFYSQESQRWLTSDPREALYLLYYWVTELVSYITIGKTVFSPKRSEQLATLSHLPVVKLLVFLESIVAALQALRQPGVNKPLLIEALFYEWHVLREGKHEFCQYTDGSRRHR